MFDRRPLDPEWMDLPTFDLQQVVDTFRFIRPVNRWLGGHAGLIELLERESHDWRPGQAIHLLDAGCGAGDSALAVARWARRRELPVRIHAVDSHPITLALARDAGASEPEIAFECRDVFDLPPGRYDYVASSMFLHHFGDAEVPAVLGRLLALCRRKLLVNDLIRAPLAYLGTWLFTLGTSSVFRHDARLSVRKGFRPAELRALLQAAGLSHFALETRFFYRLLLTIDKEA